SRLPSEDGRGSRGTRQARTDRGPRGRRRAAARRARRGARVARGRRGMGAIRAGGDRSRGDGARALPGGASAGRKPQGGPSRTRVTCPERSCPMGLSQVLPQPEPATARGKATAMARVIAFANQKGGVAKTTSTLNLAVALAEQGKRVLTIDLDPQGNLTMSQGLNPDAIERSMYDVLVHRLPLEQVVHKGEIDL